MVSGPLGWVPPVRPVAGEGWYRSQIQEQGLPLSRQERGTSLPPCVHAGGVTYWLNTGFQYLRLSRTMAEHRDPQLSGDLPSETFATLFSDRLHS